MDWQEGDLDLNGVRIHYYRRGSGRPLVLAHGASDNGKCWGRVAAALEGEYDIVAYDARYHGLSDAPEGGQMAGGEDLVAVVEALGFERPAIMGHSMGARSVAQAAGMRPDLFRCAVLEDPPWRDETPAQPPRTVGLDLTGLSVDEIIAAGREQSPTWHEDEFPAWADSKKQFRPPPDWRARIPSIAAGWRDTADAIRVPTLLVCGGNAERGRIVNAAVAAEAASLNQRIEVVTFPEAGHNVRREAFDGFVEAVRGFLGRD
jgi:pimeloyl-ACP methyl ester carboxylesterase